MGSDRSKKKSPNAMDMHVGNRVRMRRRMIQMSQQTLAKHLGITFQQVQKYENGTNRIGASRLQHIATILGIPVAYFFEGGPEAEALSGDKGISAVMKLLATQDGLALAKAFHNIKDSKLRRRIVRLVSAIED